MVTLLALLACGPSDDLPPPPTGGQQQSEDPGTEDPGTEDPGTEDPTETPEESDVEPMTPVELLFRASLDLRGVRPSLEEIEAVEADPEAVEGMIEEFLADPRFGGQVMSHFAPIYLTRVDSHYVSADDYGLTDQPGFLRAVGEEPLRILEYIAQNDLPYYEVVTADWTMANEILGAAWPLDYPQGETGWRQVRYTDGRPAAGVLTTNSMWWRYMSNGSNANRGRANAVSRILLCNDYLSRPIEFDRNVNLLDSDAVNDALQNNPGCAACHHTLDPLASYLWGFYYYIYYSALDTTYYHPEREQLWQEMTGVEPSYYGVPGYDLTDLSYQIASDARLPQCAVEQVFSALLQREAGLEDTDELTQHREVFLDGGLTLRSLYRSMLTSDLYRAREASDERYTTRKFPGPDLLASQIEDLTGFRWVYADYDMLQTDTYGVRTLAGGVDGVYATSPATEPMATMALVVERLAEAASWHVVEHDRAHPEEPMLFSRVNFTETYATAPDLLVDQIQDLHLRLMGDRVEADGPEVEANLELWNDLYEATGDPAQAWSGLLSVLLRDPEFLFY